MHDDLITYLMARLAALAEQRLALAPAVIQATQTIAQYNALAAAEDEIRAVMARQQDDGSD